MKTFYRAWIVVLLAVALTGCAAKSPYGPDAAVYSQGSYQVAYQNTMHRTVEAARTALTDLEMTITSVQTSPGSERIEAAMKNGTRVNLTLSAVRPDVTAVNIKVGTYGDEDLSEKISEKIEDRVTG